MIENLLDAYELKARVAPGLIVALAPLVDVFFIARVLSNLPIFAASGLCSLALVYALGLFARSRGKAIEPELWKRWGGPPSTRLLRRWDSTFGDDLKGSIRSALVSKLSVRLLTPDEEGKNPERADKAIIDAFTQVRQYLRQHDPDGLWSKNNAEYGFCRNLLGCRVEWAVLALAAGVFAAIYGAKVGPGLLSPASAFGILSFVCAIYFGWAVLPNATKRIADRYAELAWMAFLESRK